MSRNITLQFRNAAIHAAILCYATAALVVAVALNAISAEHFDGIIAWVLVILTYSFGGLGIFCHLRANYFCKKLKETY